MFTCMTTQMSKRMFLHTSIRMFMHMPVHISTHTSIHMSMSMRISKHMSIPMSMHNVYTHPRCGSISISIISIISIIAILPPTNPAFTDESPPGRASRNASNIAA